MEQPKVMLEDLYAKLTLEDEEDGGIIVEDTKVPYKNVTFILVGRFLTEENINFCATQNFLASLWRPKVGAEIHDIGGYRYSFVFYHIIHVKKVLEGGSWSFEHSLLVFQRISDIEDPHLVQLNEFDIWVQIYDVPSGFIFENILKNVENSLGKYVKSDPSNFDGIWKAFVRIRVTMSINKPLK